METPTDPDTITHRLREALARVATVMRVDDWERAKQVGLNPTQLAILDLLEGRPGGLAVREIAAYLGVSQPTATDSINALERKGLVEKLPSSTDRRVVTVMLSAEGLRLSRHDNAAEGAADRAIKTLPAMELEMLLLTMVRLIRELQETNAIPIQRMCATCRHFAPFAQPGTARPHHCRFVDAAFGQRDLRIECRDHEIAAPASRAATWEAFQAG